MSSPVELRTEPLSAIEARWVARAGIAQSVLFALVAAGCIGAALALAPTGRSSWGEWLFAACFGTLALLGLALLARGAIGAWRDGRVREKLVVKGRVHTVDRRVSSYGLRTVIRVGERFAASEPLYSPVPGFLGRVQVGDLVEIAYLARSGRTLSVVPA